MKNRKKKINVKRCIMVFCIILVFIIIIANIGKNSEEKELSILLNNEIIETLKDVIIDENNNIYFSKEDIQTIFDETIYYNEAEKELITTYDSNIALLKIDEDYALINDEQTELNGKLQEVDKTIYLPITDLSVVYDIEVEYSQKNNRIIIDSTLEKKVEASIIKRTCVKKKKGLFSKKIENLIIGDNVVILEESGKYKKVRTSARKYWVYKN